jgi:hypothetical protein
MKRVKSIAFALSAGVLLLGACSAEEKSVSEKLVSAFDDSASSTSYRVTQATGQRVVLAAAGVNNVTKLDPDKPNLVGEITPGGQHITMDLTSLMGLSDQGLDYVGFEMWTSPERIVIDSTGYQALADAAPQADLGPFSPGISFVDLGAIGAGNPDVVKGISGGLADLKVIAKNLPAAMTDVQQTSSAPVIFSGKTNYADFTSAIGGNLENTAKSAAAGVAANLDIDPELLADIYIKTYRSTIIDVTVELDDQGRVRVITSKGDLSGIYTAAFGKDNALDLPKDQLAEAAEAFTGAVLELETRLTFEPDDKLVLKPMPTDPEDRTDQWRAFLVTAGIIKQ